MQYNRSIRNVIVHGGRPRLPSKVGARGRTPTTKYYVNGPGGPIAVYAMNIDDFCYYFIKDQVGSTRALIQGNGDVVEYTNYHPFGEVMESWSSYDEPLEFTGKEHDKHRTFDYTYFGARYYDPELGVFSTIDKAGQFSSGFAYCGNNPVLAVDPDGNLLWFLPGILIAAAQASAMSGATYAITGTLTGQFNWKDFGYSFLQGALSGGIASSMSLIPGIGANHMALRAFRGAATSAGTSAIMGEGFDGANILGSTVGEVAAQQAIAEYNTPSDNKFYNMVAEISQSGVHGSFSGLAGGMTKNVLHGRPLLNNIDRYSAAGAASGVGSALARSAVLGVPVLPPESVQGALATGKAVWGHGHAPVFRSGGLMGLFAPNGFAGFGRDLVVNGLSGRSKVAQEVNNYQWIAEASHYWQYLGNGYASVLGHLGYEHMFFSDPYSVEGTFEWMEYNLTGFLGHPFPEDRY